VSTITDQSDKRLDDPALLDAEAELSGRVPPPVWRDPAVVGSRVGGGVVARQVVEARVAPLPEPGSGGAPGACQPVFEDQDGRVLGPGLAALDPGLPTELGPARPARHGLARTRPGTRQVHRRRAGRRVTTQRDLIGNFVPSKRS